jgi:hypothetical protein
MQQTQSGIDATGTTVAGTATQIALVSPTPTPVPPTPTSQRPTLPPEWTPTPPPTLAPTVASLPPPAGVTGMLGAWGGADVENLGFYEVGVYNFNAGLNFQRVGDQIGADVSVYNNTNRIVYTRYDRLVFGTTLQAVNVNGSEIDNIPESWRGQNIFEPKQPSYSYDGSRVVFVARTESSGEGFQVFIFNLNDRTVTNLTNDNNDYSFARISPDNNTVVAVRNDILSGTGTDLIMIDVFTGSKFALTQDQDTYFETNPIWTPDGSQIIYAAAPANNRGDHDIVIRNASGAGSPDILVRDNADDIFPSISPNGQWLAFASNRANSYDIFILEIATGTLSQLTTTPDQDEFPGMWR